VGSPPIARSAAASRRDDDTDPGTSEPVPKRDEFMRLVGVADGRAPALLRVLLARCKPEATLAERNLAIEQLGRFVVAGPAIATSGPSPLARLDLLVQALEKLPAARARVAAVLGAVLRDTSAIKLFAVVGLPNDRGLLAETSDRLARKLLPTAPDDRDLAALFARIVRSTDDYNWLGPAADGSLRRLGAVLGAETWQPLREAARDAIGLLSTRVAALGMGENLLSRTERGPVRDSPFFRINRAQPQELPALIAACRHELDRYHVQLEEHGVSVDVVYSLDAITRSMLRIERLLPLIDGSDDTEYEQLRNLLFVLGRGVVGERSFTQLMADNLRLLARKVIERAGRTGEHYVTSSRREYWKMMSSAAGGGVVTAGTIIGKFLVKWGHFPLFIDGLFSSLLYAGSFLMIQFLGFTLATKQPSMTAAALAGTIRDRAGPDRLTELVALITRIARSQFAAAIGNVATVIIVAIGFDFLWQTMRGSPFLDEKDAKAVIASFDPLGSGTILFAALTGVLLWMSSLVAGWFENWVVYRRLPEAIEHHRLGKTFGRQRMARAARFVERQAAGFGGSVALGFFLGMTPAFAKFFGLPLDVRHITLSSGSLTMALSSTGIDAVGWNAIISAWVGIVIIGLLNFGVSFTLALIVALRARDVPRGERRTLPWAVMRRFFRRPLEFFWPPKDPPGAPTATAHH
jgi:site-specific recombinase